MPANRAITGHTALTGAALAAGDLIEVVDVSDATDAATGSNKRMTPVELGAGLGLLGGLGYAPLAGAVLTVSATGNDTTGARGRLDRPYLTLAAAKAAAQSGDTIIVWPGAYTCSASLAKAGVCWHFCAGATVTFASDVSTAGIWDDGGAAMTFNVTGTGAFVRSTADESLAFPLVKCSHASSVISVKAHSLRTTGSDNGECSVVLCAAGTLDVEAVTISQTGTNSYAVWWTNGKMTVSANRIESEYVAAFAQVNATPTGDGHVAAQEMTGLVFSGGSDSAAAFWVDAHTVRPTPGSVNVVQTQGSSRLYVTAQKIFASVKCIGGLLYVTSPKISANVNGNGTDAGLIYVSGGTARITVSHLDPVTYTGEMMKVIGGTLELTGGGYVGGASSNGFEHVGGTSRLMGTRINTAAASAKNPVTVSGTGLILDRCTLVSDGIQNSVTAASGKTITNYGSKANVAKHANVTVNVDALTVDANVV